MVMMSCRLRDGEFVIFSGELSNSPIGALETGYPTRYENSHP